MAEETEIEKWNPHKMAEQVQDKIRLEVSALIPPDMWERLVKEQVTKFTTTTQRSKGYGGGYEDVPPGIAPLIAKALEEASEKFIKEQLEKLSYPEISAWVKEFIEKNWEQCLKTRFHEALMGHMMNVTMNVDMVDPRTDPNSPHYDPNYRAGY